MFQHKASFASSPEYSRNSNFGGWIFFFFFWLAGSFDLTSFLLGSRHFGYDYFKGFGSGTTVVLTGHFIASAEHCKGRLSLGKISVGVKTSPSPGRITHKFEWICVQ